MELWLVLLLAAVNLRRCERCNLSRVASNNRRAERRWKFEHDPNDQVCAEVWDQSKAAIGVRTPSELNLLEKRREAVGYVKGLKRQMVLLDGWCIIT